MCFKFLEERMAKIEERFMEHVRDSVKERTKQKVLITKKEWESFHGNSYERKVLHPLLDNECLLSVIEYYYSQTGWKKSSKFDIPETYNETIQREFLPLLMERFKELLQKNNP